MMTSLMGHIAAAAAALRGAARSGSTALGVTQLPSESLLPHIKSSSLRFTSAHLRNELTGVQRETVEVRRYTYNVVHAVNKHSHAQIHLHIGLNIYICAD